MRNFTAAMTKLELETCTSESFFANLFIALHSCFGCAPSLTETQLPVSSFFLTCYTAMGCVFRGGNVPRHMWAQEDTLEDATCHRITGKR